VRPQFFDSSLRGFFAKNRVPLLKEPLRQLRDVFGVLNQVANLNSAHTNSVFGLTTQAQRRRPRGAPIATATARRRSLQRMVSLHMKQYMCTRA
jgi:hypothetical protein